MWGNVPRFLTPSFSHGPKSLVVETLSPSNGWCADLSQMRSLVATPALLDVDERLPFFPVGSIDTIARV